MELPAQVGVRVLTVTDRRELHWEHDRLAAPYWRFYWNRTRGARVVLDSGEIALEPHTGYLVAPDTDFSARCDRPVDHFYVHFTLNLPLHRVKPGLHRLPGSPVLEPAVRQLLKAMEAAALTDAIAPQRDAVRDASAAPAATSVPVLAAGLSLAAFGQLDAEAVEIAPADHLVREVEQAIETGLPARVDLHVVAERLGTSERTLRRRFRAATGETPRAWAERRRVEQACILLHFSDSTVDEIAEQTGFCDRYHFSRVFSNHRGMGPAAFRRVVEEVPGAQPTPQ